MLSAGDWQRMAADLAEVRADNAVSIVIRRGMATLAAQSVRIVGTRSQGRTVEGQRTQESRGRVLVCGSTSFDVAPGDRFNDAGGVLYQVIVVQPNRRAGVVAEAEMVE